MYLYRKVDACDNGVCRAGFGSTVADIDVSTAKVFTKTRFSMLIPEVDEEIKRQSTRKSVVIFGVMVSSYCNSVHWVYACM